MFIYRSQFHYSTKGELLSHTTFYVKEYIKIAKRLSLPQLANSKLMHYVCFQLYSVLFYLGTNYFRQLAH